MDESAQTSSIKRITRNIPWWVKSLVLLAFSGVICYKILLTPINLQFDFPSFLALLLALFSVGLAAMFYFKATDTSNAFYDNTYKFTRDIAELLVKIESGFGEKLRHLEEAYTGIQVRFDKLPSRLEVKDAKRELKEEEKELQEILKSKEKLIEDLLTKAQLRDEEKQIFLDQLNEKDQELQEVQSELIFLRRRLRHAELSTKSVESKDILLKDFPFTSEVLDYLNGPVIHLIEPEYIATRPTAFIQKKFRRVREDFPPTLEVHDQMVQVGILDDKGNLTVNGAEMLRSLAKRYT